MYPELKDLYKNVLNENNFSNVDNIKKTVKNSHKKEKPFFKKIKYSIDKTMTEQDKKILKSLEQLRLK